MKLTRKLIPFFFVLFLFSACNKSEGPGGAATITGKVHITVRDGFWNDAGDFDAADYDVFLIYGGENTVYDDDMKTSYDGTFRFQYLEPGTYQVFVYTDCPVPPATGHCGDGGEKALITTIEITGKKEVYEMGTIEVDKRI